MNRVSLIRKKIVLWAGIAPAILLAAGTQVFAADSAAASKSKVKLSQPIPVQTDAFKLADFRGIQRKLAKEPAYASKPRYTIWVLGDDMKSVMPMVWDESSPGKGYDTLYLDLNYNGDLTDVGEKFASAPPDKDGTRVCDIKDIKAKTGPDTFGFHICLNAKSEAVYPSNYGRKAPFAEYGVSDLPDRVPLQWGTDLKTAPVHQLGGLAVLLVNGKQPGESLGKFETATTVEFWTTIAHVGDSISNRLCFAGSQVPVYGGPPLSFLRVLAPDGAVREEISFNPGCS